MASRSYGVMAKMRSVSKAPSSPRAMSGGPRADQPAAAVGVAAFVDDEVGRSCFEDRLPAPVGFRQDLLEPFGPQPVFIGTAAAVAVDEPAPVKR